jgi:hypothetical protein
MSTYKVTFNHLDYLNLNINKKKLMLAVGKGIGGSKAFMSYSWDNLSLKDAWVDQGGSFDTVEGLKSTQKPDITTWNGANLLLTPKAYDGLKEHLESYGEFLPITIDEQEHYVFNCLNVVTADKAQSEADIVNDLWMGIKSIGFEDEIVDSNLVFKSKFDRCSTLYCGQKLKDLTDTLGLEGLLFLEELTADF